VGGLSEAQTRSDAMPSSSRERGTAGPEKGAMAFLDDTEATTYNMLKQILQNHCATQTLCLPHTLVACGVLVALVCAQLDETRGVLEPVVMHTLADLKRSTRARRTTPPLAPFPAECLVHETPAHLDQSEAVFQALARFLHDSLAAERVTLAGAERIVLSLLADVCAMLTHQYAHTVEEVEARIDWLRGPLQSQITAYHRQWDQGDEHARQHEGTRPSATAPQARVMACGAAMPGVDLTRRPPPRCGVAPVLGRLAPP
jgi:hypothetical protein